MSATATPPRRKKRGHHEEEHENEERWLVSFADMMTLLMCLFMVLFSISSVNVSKLKVLQKSLQEAFSGKVLPGGERVMQTGADSKGREAPEASQPQPVSVQSSSSASSAANADPTQGNREQHDFDALKRRIDATAKQLGLSKAVQTTVAERGLVVRLRTDGVFFTPGSAALQPAAQPIVRRLSHLVAAEDQHPIVVEGYTDSTPIATAAFPSNWELSGARASSVMRGLAAGGMEDGRERSVRGFAERHPIATNATSAGRAANRRVEIVLSRLHRRAP